MEYSASTALRRSEGGSERLSAERRSVPPVPAVPDGTAPDGTAPDVRAELLLAERESLHRFITGLIRQDPYHVEDIVQETLLRAWQAGDSLDWHDRPIRLWLFRVARRLVIDDWRKDRTVPVGIAAEGFPAADAVADRTAQVLDRQVLVESLRSLDRVHQEAVVRVHLLGQSGVDAARALGIPGGTLKSRTHYGVQALRRHLADRGVLARGVAS
ncbi:sigma-70 family RNA polymerase sigma factor [Kitasatospora sp. NPDC050463]|uniref:sigma-70 family RNA polymerase sigma factor n=1 Tax=Kitasatospora sp. NPDC050463 TaxID=3155786 RepID=UPI0033EBA60E